MPKRWRFHPFAALRSFRWWLITYGSIKPFQNPLLVWFRTPPFSVLVFAAGFAAGVWFVLRFIPC